MLALSPGEEVTRFHRLRRADMRVRRHLPLPEAKRADRDQRQPDRAVPPGFIGPAHVTRTGIAGEEDVARPGFDQETRPERPVAVGAPTAAPMMVAGRMDAIVGAMFVIAALDHRLRGQPVQRRATDRLAPVQHRRRDALRLQDRVIAQARDDLGLVALP